MPSYSRYRRRKGKNMEVSRFCERIQKKIAFPKNRLAGFVLAMVSTFAIFA